jgi:cell division protein FtsW
MGPALARGGHGAASAAAAPSAAYHAPLPARRAWRDNARIWWRELDKVLLGLIVLLMLVGTAGVLAASPAGAADLSTSEKTLDPFLFFKKHLAFQAVGLALMLGVSFASRDDARRIGVLAALGMFGLLLLVPVIGVEKNGAVRWLNVGMSLQPSEFLKPGFAVALAWILSWRLRDPNLPVLAAASILTGVIFALLMLQPNLGEALLFAGTWFVLVLLSGVPVSHLASLIAGGAGLITLVYLTYENGRHRIDAFLGGGTEFDQVDLAFRTLTNGGWFGNGLWLGIRKNSLPEAHTDYIFSVIGEEFGLVMCAAVVVIYLAIIVRVLLRMASEDDLFALLAGSALIAQFGGQAFMNILVNLKLFPSKGTTLPLISYGGSSTLAICFALGLLLAITRRNPFLERETPGLKDLTSRALPARQERPKEGRR